MANECLLRIKLVPGPQKSSPLAHNFHYPDFFLQSYIWIPRYKWSNTFPQIPIEILTLISYRWTTGGCVVHGVNGRLVCVLVSGDAQSLGPQNHSRTRRQDSSICSDNGAKLVGSDWQLTGRWDRKGQLKTALRLSRLDMTKAMSRIWLLLKL